MIESKNYQEKILNKKFRDAQAYLKANGFSRSTRTLFQDIERCEKKYK